MMLILEIFSFFGLWWIFMNNILEIYLQAVFLIKEKLIAKTAESSRNSTN